MAKKIVRPLPGGPPSGGSTLFTEALEGAVIRVAEEVQERVLHLFASTPGGMRPLLKNLLFNVSPEQYFIIGGNMISAEIQSYRRAEE
ncbi:MAG: hypothetical protein JXA18_00770 [Chitinispirillaceae bacterium]|nr:hypothetical protein [Chitinispirillaceae bacterium]